MLKVTHGEDKIEIRFLHKICESFEVEGLTGRCVDESRRCSIVTVALNGHHVGQGVAVCHPTDNFCRAFGRKKALTNALHLLDKDLRTAVWKEYKVRCSF